MKKGLKRLLCGALVLACLPISAAMFSSCKDKTVTEIHTVEEFMEQIENVQTYERSNSFNKDLGTLRLMADLDFSGVAYTPKMLGQNFDGNGFSLNNITINEYAKYNYDFGVGVFSNNYPDGDYIATISNLTINNLVINYTGNETPVGGLLGVALGYMEEAEAGEATDETYDHEPIQPAVLIENVSVNGKINAPQTSAVGGIAGSVSRISMKNCKSSVEIVGGDKTGGIVGENDKYSKIIDSANTGKITGGDKVGGVCGQDGWMVNCSNKGDVTGKMNVGGIVGYTGFPISGCINEGNIEGTDHGDNDYSDVGGIAGCAVCYTVFTYKGNISNNAKTTNCVNKGNVISAYLRVGGIAGYSDQDISNCENEGAVQGKAVVGGIIGWWATAGSITKCKNSGDITANQDAGGLIGGISVTGMVTFMNSHNTGKVTGQTNVAGLVGASYATIDDDLLYTCSNTGELVCDGTKNDIYNKLQ